MYHLAEYVNEHKNASNLVWIYRESEDEVHGNEFPALCRGEQRLRRGTKGRTRLHPLTELAGSNARTDTGAPTKVAAHRVICILSTTTPNNRCVIILIGDTQTQITMIWYDITGRVAGNS